MFDSEPLNLKRVLEYSGNMLKRCEFPKERYNTNLNFKYHE